MTLMRRRSADGRADERMSDEPAAAMITRAWVRGEVTMMQVRAVGGHAMGAARDLRWTARHAAYAAGQAGASHRRRVRTRWPPMPSRPYVLPCRKASTMRQGDRLPDAIRELVLDDQRLRNDMCWSVFELLSGQVGGPMSLRAHPALGDRRSSRCV
jgi:hypothetical protein